MIKGFRQDGKAEPVETKEAKEAFQELRETLADRPYYRGITENTELLSDPKGKRKLYLVNSAGDEGYAMLNDRQKQAVELSGSRRMEEAFIDRKYTERVMDAEYSSQIHRAAGKEWER